MRPLERDGGYAGGALAGGAWGAPGAPMEEKMKRRILLVEDDDIFLRPLQRSLEVAGYDVLVAPSGEDAIDLLKHEDADLVLTDKRLPGMDGVELVRRVKAEHADLAMVIM